MDVDAVVDRIAETAAEQREAAAAVRQQLDAADEPPFVHSVDPVSPDGATVAAVDGGLARESFHGLDVIMTRAVAPVFTYSNGSLATADYQPEQSPRPRIETVEEPVDRAAVDTVATLQRLKDEISAAASVVGDADLLLLDGSLVPQPQDRPDDDSPLFEAYEDVVDRYKDLYASAADHGTVLAGVVEDSRSAHLGDALQHHGVDPAAAESVRDTVLLSHLLEHGERTVTVRYSHQETPVLDDIGVAPDDIGVFYLAAAKHDRPVRVELYRHTEHDVDAVAGQLLGVAGAQTSYAVPPVLVEADQRAKLSRQDVELVTKRVAARLAHEPSAAELRRDRRPF